jgi:hypothetical protein
MLKRIGLGVSNPCAKAFQPKQVIANNVAEDRKRYSILEGCDG